MLMITPAPNARRGRNRIAVSIKMIAHKYIPGLASASRAPARATMPSVTMAGIET